MTRAAFLILLCGFCAPAFAQLSSGANADQPIEITAQKALEWDRTNQMYRATGGARAVQGTFSIDAAEMDARYEGDQSNLTTLEARGNVVIVNGADKVTGQKAVYDMVAKQAEVTGGTVTLTRDKNVLTGERATVDMNTNISKLYGGVAAPARAVFYPGAKKTGAQ